MTWQLVATDLDGTLLHSDSTISDYTGRVLSHLDHAGIPTVIVTGRPLRTTRGFFEHVGEHGLAIVSNGAVIWSVHDDAPLQVNSLADGEVSAIGEAIRAAVPGTLFAVETLAGISMEPEYHERHFLTDDVQRAPLAELPQTGVVKLLAVHEELAPQEFWDAAAAVVGDRATITWSSEHALLEISAPGVTKASALATVCAQIEVSAAEVVFFGDMPNDLPAFEVVGLACAVANAHPSVIAAATRVVGSNDEDGVARTLVDIFDLALPASAPSAT